MITGSQIRGFSKSGKKSIIIPNGSMTHTTVLDLGGNFAFVLIGVSDCAGFGIGAQLSIQIGLDAEDDLYDAYIPNDPTEKWSKVMPNAGSCFFRVDGLDFAHFLKFTVSVNMVADVQVDVWGFDGA